MYGSESEDSKPTIAPLFGQGREANVTSKTARSALVALHDAFHELLAENERLKALSSSIDGEASPHGSEGAQSLSRQSMAMPRLTMGRKSMRNTRKSMVHTSSSSSQNAPKKIERSGETASPGCPAVSPPRLIFDSAGELDAQEKDSEDSSHLRLRMMMDGGVADSVMGETDVVKPTSSVAKADARNSARNSTRNSTYPVVDESNRDSTFSSYDKQDLALKQTRISVTPSTYSADSGPILELGDMHILTGGGSLQSDDDSDNGKGGSRSAVEMVNASQSVMTARATLEEAPSGGVEFSISPVGRFRLSWDITWIGLLAIETWATPFRVFFLASEAVSASLNYMSHLITAFFFADIVLNFFTGYLDEKNECIIKDNYTIARTYLVFWFWVDLLVTIPYDDLFATSESGTVAVLRATRAQKALRLLRIVKIFRILKLMKYAKVFSHLKKQTARLQVGSVTEDKIVESEDSDQKPRRLCGYQVPTTMVQQGMVIARLITYPTAVFLGLAIIAHFHACLWRICLPLGLAVDMETALDDYYKCFCWAYTTLTVGTYEWPEMTPSLWAVHMVLLSERLLLAAFMIIVLVFWGFLKGQADTGVTLRLTDALHYMARHAVSVDTQLQVLASIQETTSERTRHRHFNQLVDKDLPHELQTMIREELWRDELQTLGLLEVVLSWNATLVGKLSQAVREEVYASSVFVFREGDVSNIAYKVLSGAVLVASTSQPDGIPPFLSGMWVGEKALINASLKRSGSLITIKMSNLLAVPGDCFRDMLTKEDLLQEFTDFCAEQLWRGLCGRCGMLGDHFSHECPELKRMSRRSAEGGDKGWLAMSRKGKDGKSGAGGTKVKMARDLRMFLEDSEILPIGNLLVSAGICSLANLEELDWDQLEPGYLDLMETDIELLREYQELLCATAIANFREERTGMMRSMLDTMSDSDHFLFLSHYKLEAGTEASLMRTELGQLIREDMTWAHVANALQTPVFLDSEDLTQLEDLQLRVRKSHNLLLLLTQNVLSRPWVLLEICTALEAGVQVLIVEVEKPGNVFSYPDENFYEDLKEGRLLGSKGKELIEKYGVTLDGVEAAIRQVFTRISLHYSPHRAAEVRKIELQAILRQCTFNQDDTDRVSAVRSLRSHKKSSGTQSNSKTLRAFQEEPAMNGTSSSEAKSLRKRGSELKSQTSHASHATADFQYHANARASLYSVSNFKRTNSVASPQSSSNPKMFDRAPAGKDDALDPSVKRSYRPTTFQYPLTASDEEGSDSQPRGSQSSLMSISEHDVTTNLAEHIDISRGSTIKV